MSLLLLTNTAGANCTGLETTGADIKMGYKAGWAEAGPRSRLVMTDNDTTHGFYYNCTSIAVTHCVLQGAYWFKNGQNATSVATKYGASTDSTTAVGSMTLYGPERQDWVKTIARTNTKFGLEFYALGKLGNALR
jgi:hypothetical protein